MKAKALKRVVRNPWFWLFIITAAFQVFRGSFGDTVIFSLAAITVGVAASGKLNYNLLNRHQVRMVASIPTALAIALALTFLPHHSAYHPTIFFVILGLVLALVWHSDAGEKTKPTQREKRARTLWAALCVGILLWELAANVFGQLYDTLTEFPTLSVLIDPALDTLWGQGLFVVLWLAAGWGFLRLGVKK
jgi:hypothetical protein